VASSRDVVHGDDGNKRRHLKVGKENFSGLECPIHHHIHPNTFSSLDPKIQKLVSASVQYGQHHTIGQCWDVATLSI